MRPLSRARRGASGLSLVEIMVAVTIISIGMLGFTGAFRFITHSIRDSRAKSLAISLAQEKIENLKHITYHRLQLTTVPVTHVPSQSFFDPDVQYDSISYPVETIRIGGITFLRGIYVSLTRLTDNEVTATSSMYPDSGLKFVTCYVLWEQRGTWKKFELENLYENPNVDPLDATLTGRVAVSGVAVAGAVVTVLEKQDWTGTTDSAGSYLFRVHGGTYSVRASSAGYYDSTMTDLLIDEGAVKTTNFHLTQVGSGTVSGNVFFSTHMVISQIVLATNTRVGHAADPAATANVEYVMLFNPTTRYINMPTGSSTEGVPWYFHETSGWINPATLMPVQVTTFVPPNKGYLIANTSFFMVGNQWITADAYYAGTDILKENDGGAFILYRAVDGLTSDAVQWADDDTPMPNAWAPSYEGTILADTACADGIGEGNFILRYSSPNRIGEGEIAWAYDSNDNRADFVSPHNACGVVPSPVMNWSTIEPIRPFSTFNSTLTSVGGIPADGAFVIADDLLGATTQAWRNWKTSDFGISQRYAQFSLKGVSTGTWTVTIATGNYYVEVASVTVPLLGGVSIPNSDTTPVWPDNSHVLLASQTAVGGYIAGSVQASGGSPLANIAVISGGVSKTTSSNGRFFTAVSTGPQTVIVNVNNANSTYNEYNTQVTVTAGVVTTLTVTLTQAGTLTGFITPDGTSGLPNIEVTASRSGAQWGAGVTDTSGAFYIRNLATGAVYDVLPVLDPFEVVSPTSIPKAAVAASVTHVGTFTVTGAEGKIGGSLTFNSSALTTGALILVSTAALGTTPPEIVASSSPARTVIYAASSKADGTYLIDVRGSTTTSYRVHVYVPVVGTDSVTISTKVYSGVMVYSTGTTTLDITVP